jgi:uncharacterized damage-inducible protein DinB
LKIDIEIPEGFAHDIGQYVAGHEYGRAKTRSLLADLSTDEIARRVLPSLHSIGALALHLGEAEYFWIQCVVCGREPSKEEKAFAYFFDTMETDVEKELTAEFVISRIDEISALTRDTLKNLTDAHLERFFVRRDLSEPRDYSLRELLHRLIDHEAHHRGQMAMIKRLIRGGEIAS